MKINEKSWIGTHIPEKQKDQLENHFIEQNKLSQRRALFAELYFNPSISNYLIAQSTQEVVKQIRLSEGVFDLLKRPKQDDCTLHFNEHKCYRWFFEEQQLMCAHLHREYRGNDMWYYGYDCFRVNFKDRTVHWGAFDGKPLSEAPEFVTEFLKTMIFMYCSDTEIEVIEPGGKSPRPKKDEKTFNDTQFSLQVVHSHWNKIRINNTGFGVSGHLRFQPHGAKLSQVKVIYIEPYMKKGLVRQAKS